MLVLCIIDIWLQDKGLRALYKILYGYFILIISAQLRKKHTSDDLLSQDVFETL